MDLYIHFVSSARMGQNVYIPILLFDKRASGCKTLANKQALPARKGGAPVAPGEW